MPKIKSHRGAAKRFKFTKSGKIRRKSAFARHLMTGKSPKRRRNLRKSSILDPADVKSVKRMLPYG